MVSPLNDTLADFCMAPDHLARSLALLGWRQRVAARMLGRSSHVIRQWTNSDAPIPAEVADWLTKTAVYLTKYPPPRLEVDLP